MNDPVETIRSFYAKLADGDAPSALCLMSADIEWNTMWHYKVDGRGPERVAEGLFRPLVAEWSSFSLEPTEFFRDGNTVISLGRFRGEHGGTRKRAEAGYAHVWSVENGRITRFRQYIDTLAVADALKP
ncbi:nuclear transport factor 2 family protein [Burkholderia pyrrocinia]|uniref:nuclear transport factor 2 family protein n=1 Tax=Burkholderia pyrrocinia TaxID=60550 RepID=UPI001FB55198|nr:nuclear transport factor 2 family protein [Burkholderia pyrrocinia]UOB59739.1 nuclear transport factor 2 family protein [Burkholderia pyrrocinia]